MSTPEDEVRREASLRTREPVIAPAEESSEEEPRQASTPSLRARVAKPKEQPEPKRVSGSILRPGEELPEERPRSGLVRQVDPETLATVNGPRSKGEFQKGLENGLQNLKASAPGVAALVAGTFGFEETAQNLAQTSANIAGRDLNELRVPTFADIESIGDIPDYLAGLFGSQTPVLASTIGSALVTRKIGGLVPGTRKLQKARKQAFDKMNDATTRSSAEASAEAARILTQQLNTREQFAASVGVVGSILGISAPDQAGLLLDEEASGSIQERAAGGLAAATASGLAGILPVNRFLQKSGLSRTTQDQVTRSLNNTIRRKLGQETGKELPQRGLVRNILSEAPKQGALESISEVAQEAVLRSTHALFKENVGMFDDEAVANYLEAAVASFIVGGALGSTGQVTSAAMLKLADVADAPGSIASDVQKRISDFEMKKLRDGIFQRGRFNKTKVSSDLRGLDERLETEGFTPEIEAELAELVGQENVADVVAQVQDEGKSLDEVVTADMEQNKGNSPLSSYVATRMVNTPFEDRIDDAIPLAIGNALIKNNRRLAQATRLLNEKETHDLKRAIGQLTLDVEEVRADETLSDDQQKEIIQQRRTELSRVLGGDTEAEVAIELAIRENLAFREAAEALDNPVDDAAGPLDQVARETLSREELEERGLANEIPNPDSAIQERKLTAGSVFGLEPESKKARNAIQTVDVPGIGRISPVNALDAEGNQKDLSEVGAVNKLVERMTRRTGAQFEPRRYGDFLLEDSGLEQEDFLATAQEINEKAKKAGAKYARDVKRFDVKTAQEFLNNFAVAVPNAVELEQDRANIEEGGFSLSELAQILRDPDVSGLPRQDQVLLINDQNNERVVVDMVSANRIRKRKLRGEVQGQSEADTANAAIGQLLQQGFRFPTEQESNAILRNAANTARDTRRGSRVSRSADQQLQMFRARGGTLTSISEDAIVERRRSPEEARAVTEAAKIFEQNNEGIRAPRLLDSSRAGQFLGDVAARNMTPEQVLDYANAVNQQLNRLPDPPDFARPGTMRSAERARDFLNTLQIEAPDGSNVVTAEEARLGREAAARRRAAREPAVRRVRKIVQERARERPTRAVVDELKAMKKGDLYSRERLIINAAIDKAQRIQPSESEAITEAVRRYGKGVHQFIDRELAIAHARIGQETLRKKFMEALDPQTRKNITIQGQALGVFIDLQEASRSAIRGLRRSQQKAALDAASTVETQIQEERREFSEAEAAGKRAKAAMHLERILELEAEAAEYAPSERFLGEGDFDNTRSDFDVAERQTEKASVEEQKSFTIPGASALRKLDLPHFDSLTYYAEREMRATNGRTTPTQALEKMSVEARRVASRKNMDAMIDEVVKARMSDPALSARDVALKAQKAFQKNTGQRVEGRLPRVLSMVATLEAPRANANNTTNEKVAAALRKEVSSAANTMVKFMRTKEGVPIATKSVALNWARAEGLDNDRAERALRVQQLQASILALSDEELVKTDHPSLRGLVEQVSELQIELWKGADQQEKSLIRMSNKLSMKTPLDALSALTNLISIDSQFFVEEEIVGVANSYFSFFMDSSEMESLRTRLEGAVNEGLLKRVKDATGMKIKVVFSAEDIIQSGVSIDGRPVTNDMDVMRFAQELSPEVAASLKGTVWMSENTGRTVKAADGSVLVYINPGMSLESQIATLLHETGHAIEVELFSREDDTIQKGIVEEYAQWLKDQVGDSRGAATVREINKHKKGRLDFLMGSGTFAALEMSADKIRNRPGVAAANESISQQYQAGFREWFADRVAEWASTNKQAQTGVEKFFKKVADLYKRLLTLVRGSEFASTPVLNAWLNSRLTNTEGGQLRQMLNRPRPTRYWNDLLTNEANAELIESVIAGEDIEDAQLNVMLKRRLGPNWMRNDQRMQDEINKVVAAKSVRDMQSTMSPRGRGTHYHLRDVISMQLTAKERNTLARVFNQPAIRDQIVEKFSDDFPWMLEIETQQDALIATGYQLWVSGQLKLAPAGKSVFETLSAQLSHTFLGEMTDRERAATIMDALRDGRIASRKTIFQAKAPADSEVARGRYGLSHAQLRIVEIFAGQKKGGTLDGVTERDLASRLSKFERLADRNMDPHARLLLARDILKGVYTEDLLNEANNSPTWALNPEKSFVLKDEFVKNGMTEIGQFLRGAGHVLGRLASGLFYGQMMVARQSKNQGLIDGANLLYRDVASKRQAQSFDQAKMSNIGKFMNQYTSLLAPLNDKQKLALRDAIMEGRILANEKNVDPAVLTAQKQYIKMMAQIRHQLQASGIDIGDRGKDRVYFPWVFDERAFGHRGKEFKRFAMQDKFLPEWRKLAEAKQKEAVRKGTAVRERNFSDPRELETFVDNYIAALASQDGFADSEVVRDPSRRSQPHVRAMLRRELDFLQRKGDGQDRKTLASFLSSDMNRVIATYINQAMKRSTFNEFLGRGRQSEVEANIIAQGGTQEDVNTFRAMVDMQMGTYGLELSPMQAKAVGYVGKAFGKDWQNLDPSQLRKAQGWVITYQNVRLLAFSALTNLVDAAGLAVRAGSLTQAVQGLRAGYKAFASTKSKRVRDSLAEQADMLGVTEQIVVQDVLGQLYGGVHFTGLAAKINDTMFKYNGMMALNRYLRMSALGTAKIYLKRHAEGAAAGNKKSQKILRDIGLEPDDLRYENGELRLLSDSEIEALVGSERPRDIARDLVVGTDDADARAEVLRDQRVKDALFRFVDEAVMRPSAMQRPGWGNDPNWGMFFHLKAFMYTYHERHMRRALAKLGERDAGPLIWMASFPAFMIAVDLFRDTVQYGPGGDPGKEDWHIGQYAVDGVQRSGVLGVGNIFADMSRAQSFGNNPLMELGGPVVTQVNGNIDALLSMDSGQIASQTYRNVPLQNLASAVANWGTAMNPLDESDARNAILTGHFPVDGPLPTPQAIK